MKPKTILSTVFYTTLLSLIIISCKKPKSGDYTYTETGTEKVYLSENSGPYNKTSEKSINTSNKVTIKNKSNSILNVDGVDWKISGDSAINSGSSSSTPSANNSTQSTYNYRGKITDKKNIEGVFTRLSVMHSYYNVTIDSTRGTFTFHKK